MKDRLDYLEKQNNKLKSEVQELRKVIKSYKYDDLTGLLRRADFNTRIDEMWHAYEEFKHHFMIAMIDLNGLHELNRKPELGGFEAGDEFIQRVANRLKDLFSDSTIFRIGGDEFIVLKQGSDIEDFNSKLTKVEDCEVGSTFTSGDLVFTDHTEMFIYVDAEIIDKKPAKRN